jgi:hypothetical protein
LRILSAPSGLSGKGGKPWKATGWLIIDSGSRHGEGIVMLRGGDLLGGDPEHV